MSHTKRKALLRLTRKMVIAISKKDINPVRDMAETEWCANRIRYKNMQFTSPVQNRI